MDDHNSIGTNTTGVTNATRQIMEEANSTRYEKIIEVDDCTVNSGLTDPTVYTPPQQPKDSSVILDNRVVPMALEGQHGGEDDMDLQSYGKKNDNQNEELEEQSQELQPFEKPMNIDSPSRDAIMAAESIPNKQEGTDR